MLGAGVQSDVRCDAQSQPCPGRQQLGREVERDAVDEVSQQGTEAHVAVGHQRQWGQEVLTELAVGDPRRAGRRSLERKAVDEQRAPTMELDVEGACVLEREAGGHRRVLDVQRQQGGILQLAEGPLVGVGDELEGLGADDRHRVVRTGRQVEGCVLVRDQTLGLDQARQQARRLEGLPFLEIRAVDLPQQDAVAPVDEAAWISERARIALEHQRLRVRCRLRR